LPEDVEGEKTSNLESKSVSRKPNQTEDLSNEKEC
jgi:hypothetical protein